MESNNRYLSMIGENIKGEGQALEDYQELLGYMNEELHWKERHLSDNDEMMERDPAYKPMTDEEKEECREYIEDMKSDIKIINEIIADEINHTVVLTGLLVKRSEIRPAQDNLANAIERIAMPGGENAD